jgi:DNA polymerase-3 subunit delta
VKIKPADADRFCAAPPDTVPLLLIYGPDTGLVKERADRATRSALDDPSDPFRFIQLSGADLAADPARLADEAAAIAFGGGRRVVRVVDAGDSAAGAVKAFLDAPMGDSLIVMSADSLGPGSKLRKLAEGAKAAAAVACYLDEGRRLDDVIRDTLAAEGLTAEADAMTFLSGHLGSDRQLTRREIEKLALYVADAGKTGGGRVTLADAMACVGDMAALTLDDLCLGATGGDMAAVDRCLSRLAGEGAAPVSILRALGRHMLRLQVLKTALDGGANPDAAARGLRPPAYGPAARALASHAGRWTEAGFAEAYRALNQAESQCKSTGMPDILLAQRTALSLAGLARRQQRR